ncbi:hypothetical protein H2O64_21690 [Kordia sp. YSTF-M3]|uniref:Uncharacterized protein n=1 Tax=Kordia aestuariivivens TaxID=2759037 RepID=A0ABR7QFV7_9FLAO|nr:hypothetical protein [Kordia aestuariivivens]MBC8757298.1 hypothetical protein [Kordia aestuariivivens]
MNITTQIVVRHFLMRLSEGHQPHTGIHPFFDNFFTKQELIDIITHIFSEHEVREVDLDVLTHDELLDIIDDDMSILRFYLHQWEQQLISHESHSTHEVNDTLEQLSHHTHYLRNKIPKDWDKYDRSNFRSLQLKAGKLRKVYGIYDINVSQDQVQEVHAPPKRFYQTQEQATEVMNTMISKSDSQDEYLHVLYLYKAI